ncbi:MAG: PASTA domain-containing protein, partial [Aeromicrobium sp.]
LAPTVAESSSTVPSAEKRDPTVPDAIAVPVLDETGEMTGGPTHRAAVMPETADSPTPRRRRRLFAAVLVLFLLIAAAIAFAAFRPTGTQVVPDVVGKQRQVAQTMLTKAGLNAKFTITDAPATREGIVVKQSADPDSKAEKGSTITLTVASGMVNLPMDDLLGAKYGEAVATLDDLGLRARKRLAVSQQDSGTVIGVSPEDRTTVGSIVILTVSSGPSNDNNDNNGDKTNKKKDKKTDNPPTEAPTTSPTSATPEPTTPTEGETP